MDIEDRIAALLQRVNTHPKTWQHGKYRVRLQGPWDLASTVNRWTIALEPYNDNDVAEGLGVTIREAISNLETRVEILLRGNE